MYSKVVRFLEQPVFLGLRNQVILILALIAVLAFTWAVRVESREVVTTADGAHWRDQEFLKLWVSREGEVTGAKAESNRLVFERTSADGAWKRLTVGVARAGQSAAGAVWAAGKTADQVAWADADRIYFANLDYTRQSVQAEASIAQPNVRALNLLNADTVQVVLDGGRVRVWSPARRELRDEPRISFEALEQVAGNGEYLGGASSRKMTLYRTVDGVPRVIDQSEAPQGPFRLVMPGAGQIAAVWQGGILARGKKTNTPGPVRMAAIAPDNAFVAAGGFPGIQHCTPQECRVVVPVDGVTAIASNEKFLAYSGPQGTGVRPFALQTVYSRGGRISLWIGALATALCCLLAAFVMIVRMFAMVVEQGRERIDNLPQKFQIPDGLLDAFREGRVVLWAGSGLSAQAGLPTRSAFIRYLIEGAETERWIDAAGMNTLLANADRGRGEDCIAAIAELLGGQANVELQSFFRMMYRRITLMTPAFVSLRKLPFSAALTTNYDTTLDRMGPRWEAGVIPMPYNPLSAIKSQQFFVWKLYGDVQTSTPLVLSRFELVDTLERISVVPEIVDRICKTRVMFFVGASLPGLIEDLRILGFRPSPGTKHYAFAGAKGSAWKRESEVLLREFGVQVTAVSESAVGQALPEFLESLVERLSQMPAPVRRAAPEAPPDRNQQQPPRVQAAG
ncbi:MAG: SIR2 family protein [Bryobacterales bacterium]|nr:SIR2 family protein [Bryobacterales bacterium]